MQVYTFTDVELSQSINQSKDVLAAGLYEAGVIDEDQFKIITEDFAVLLAPSKLFGNKIKEALGWEDDKSYYKVVRLNNFNKNNKEKEDVHQPEDSDTEGVDNGD